MDDGRTFAPMGVIDAVRKGGLVAIAIAPEDEAVSSDGRTDGAGILDNEDGGAKGGGRFGAFLVL